MGIHGALFLVKPSKLYYTKSIFLIKYYQKVFGNLFFKRGIDETILYFSVFPEWSTSLIKLWTRCTEDYSFKKCPVYHYQIHKPFRPLVDEPNNKKITFKIWDKFAKSLLTSHPEFLDYFKHIREFRNIDF